MAMQECPQTFPFLQFGAPPVLESADPLLPTKPAGAGDCIGPDGATFGFIIPEKIDGLLAGAG